jgi:hypothetical protein
MIGERGVTRVMRWFRTNRGTSGALALFALALQIALAFGHIHLRDFAGVPGVVVAHATAPDPASDHNNGHSTDDYCLICAAAKLAGTLVLPSQIALVLPVSSTDEPHVYVCSAFRGRMDHALFSARAPPLA